MQLRDKTINPTTLAISQSSPSHSRSGAVASGGDWGEVLFVSDSPATATIGAPPFSFRSCRAGLWARAATGGDGGDAGPRARASDAAPAVWFVACRQAVTLFLYRQPEMSCCLGTHVRTFCRESCLTRISHPVHVRKSQLPAFVHSKCFCVIKLPFLGLARGEV